MMKYANADLVDELIAGKALDALVCIVFDR